MRGIRWTCQAAGWILAAGLGAAGCGSDDDGLNLTGTWQTTSELVSNSCGGTVTLIPYTVDIVHHRDRVTDNLDLTYRQVFNGVPSTRRQTATLTDTEIRFPMVQRQVERGLCTFDFRTEMAASATDTLVSGTTTLSYTRDRPEECFPVGNCAIVSSFAWTRAE